MAVYQRNTKKGSWYLTVTINGKRIRKNIKGARTKRQAEQAERVLRDDFFENRYGDGGQKIFSDFVENSYKPYAIEHKKGYEVEFSILKVLIEKFGKKKLIEISPEEIENFKRQRASEITTHKAIRAKSTVNRDIAVLSAVFNLAKDFGEIKENPVSNVKYYTNLNSRDRILSDDEETILFEHIRNDVKFSRQIEILLYTGMRRGEIFQLEWRDIDLKDGFINLRKETTKTRKPRTIPMLSNVQAIFESLYLETGEVRGIDEIFSGIKSRATKCSEKFRKVCGELGLQDLTIHSLRHTFSTRADRFGVGAFAQKDLLGHAKLSMTDRYTHLSNETLKDNMSVFEQHISHRKDTKQKKEHTKAETTANLLTFKNNAKT